VNPGAIFKITSKLCLYTAYQIGNYGVRNGNHQFLWEFGYNFNWCGLAAWRRAVFGGVAS